jgi:phage tail sheath protein FI
MITKLATPGVYIDEISTIPPSVAEVDSAIPAFIGYTETAKKYADGDLTLKAQKIDSWSEFQNYYAVKNAQGLGIPPWESDASVKVEVHEKTDDGTVAGATVGYEINISKAAGLKQFNLYYAVRHYFDNGGGSCYIVSVKDHSGPVTFANEIEAGLNLIREYDEPTILCVPEMVFMNEADYNSTVRKMIDQAAELKDRIALIDPRVVTPETTANPHGTIAADVGVIRAAASGSVEANRYAAAYYPFLETTYAHGFDFDALTIDTHTKAGVPAPAPNLVGVKMEVLGQGSALYVKIKEAVKSVHVVLPPSAAMAGIYARVDTTKGVWKAPANEGLTNVVKPNLDISSREQESLNVDTMSGKSINVIRTFPGYGTVVWGARTLNGNDNEWRYINVRRFFMVVEESIKKSVQWAVFEPNTASTWVKVKGMIDNYLFQKWQQGALAGAKPEEAFFVKVGLGKTMTSLDVLEGRMNVEIGMAVSRPAEFIILKFSHMLQTS